VVLGFVALRVLSQFLWVLFTNFATMEEFNGWHVVIIVCECGGTGMGV